MLRKVNDECDRQLAELHRGEIFQEQRRLNEEIAEIDGREHPSLDLQARTAGPFFRVWLFERLTSENPPDLNNPQELATIYAKDWYAGWRPKA
jgi:hypothetical protein